MKRYVIDSIQDVRSFFTNLHLRTGVAFLPEDDLAGVLNVSGKVAFSKAEVAYFDDIVLDCFVFCNDHHLDLHEIVETMQQELGFDVPKQNTGTGKPVVQTGAMPVFATSLFFKNPCRIQPPGYMAAFV